MGMTLREGNREYYYEMLDKHFPGLRKRYEEIYGNNYIVSSGNSGKLMEVFRGKCVANNIIFDTGKIFEFMQTLFMETQFIKIPFIQTSDGKPEDGKPTQGELALF